MANRFAGKKFLVTGAGKGFGRAIAVSLSKAGGKVYALGETQPILDSLVKDYPEIIPINQDIADWEGTRHKLAQLEVLDGLVNNVVHVGANLPATDYSRLEILTCFENSLFSAINCTQVVAKMLIEDRRPGSIIFMSSFGGEIAYSENLLQNMSKAALDMVTKQFALELGPDNIRVNSVKHTQVVTDGIAKTVEELTYLENQRSINKISLDKHPKTQAVIGRVFYFLSDSSAMVTGGF